MKYQKSELTKKYRKLSILMWWLSLIVLLTPVSYYVVRAFMIGNIVEKLSLGCLATAAIIITSISLLRKLRLRSPLWICILGIYVVLDKIIPLLIMVAIGVILDELILSPLYKKFKDKADDNANADERDYYKAKHNKESNGLI